jgi:hypothetical protein
MVLNSQSFSKSLEPEFIEALRLSMQYDIVKAADIIGWADEWIVAEASPAQLLFEISAAQNARDLGYVLHRNTELHNDRYSCRILLGYLAQQFFTGLLNEQVVLGNFDRLISQNLLAKDWDEESICRWLSNNFYTAQQNFARKEFINEVKDDIKMFLSIFLDYRLNNYEHWAQIHDLVNVKITAYINKPRNRRVN